MPKVVSYVPEELYLKSKVEVPAGWHIVFPEGVGEDDVIAACNGADFLLVTAPRPSVTARVLQNIPSVAMVQVFGAGYDKVDIDAAREVNLPVANTPGQNATTVAEFTIGALIALQRKILLGDREVKAGRHKEIEQALIKTGLKEVRGTKIGLLGLGKIGRQVARLASFMGAEVSYYDPYRCDKKVEEELNVTYLPFLELLQHNEAISLHVLLNKDTYNLISRKELSLMPPGALLINTSRGEVVDQAALAEALESGHLGGAAVDNFAPDPPPPDHPLLNLSPTAGERFLATPHIAGVTAGSFSRMLKEALANLRRAAAGEEPWHVVNGVKMVRGRPL